MPRFGSNLLRFALVVLLPLALHAVPQLLAWGDFALAVSLLVREDGLIESAGAVFCLAGGVALIYFSAAALVGRRGGTVGRSSARLPAVMRLGLGLVLVATALEEISWGQRLLGFDTPSTLVELNRQGEFNLHNLIAFEPEIGRNRLQEAAMVVLVGYLGLAPPLAAAIGPLRRRLHAWGIPLARGDVSLSFWLNLAALLWAVAGRETTLSLAAKIGEEAFETAVQWLLAVLAFDTLRPAVSESPQSAAAVRRATRVGLWLGALFGLALGYQFVVVEWPQARAESLTADALAAVTEGRFGDAEPPLRRAIELAPENELAHDLLAQVLARTDRVDEALHQLDRALAELGPSATLYNRLGHLQLARQQLALAEAAFESALALAPDWPELHNNLGVIAFRQGRDEDARARFLRALELDPALRGVRENLERVEERLRRLDPRAREGSKID